VTIVSEGHQNEDRIVQAASVCGGSFWGEGRHLRRFVHQLLHKDLPKQYATFIGTRSILTHTYDRVERMIPPDQVYTILGQDHLRHSEVQRQIAGQNSFISRN